MILVFKTNPIYTRFGAMVLAFGFRIQGTVSAPVVIDVQHVWGFSIVRKPL